MKKLSVLLAVIFLLSFNLTAIAQDEEEERDLLEISLVGGLGMPVGGIADAHDNIPGAKLGYGFGIGLGYFVRSNVVMGVDFRITEFPADATDEADGTKHRLFNPNVFMKYYLVGESNWEPYLKLHIGVENAKFTALHSNPRAYGATSYDPSLAFGIGGGLFYYSADYSGLYLEAEYHHANTSDAECEYATETLVFGENLSVLSIRAGIRLIVGSGE